MRITAQTISRTKIVNLNRVCHLGTGAITTIESGIHATQMALMRYYLQGLLKRQKLAGNQYEYKISDRSHSEIKFVHPVVCAACGV